MIAPSAAAPSAAAPSAAAPSSERIFFSQPRLRTLGWGLLLLAWVLIVVLLTSKLVGQALDDVFITYRYAQNLAAGEGLVFNSGERVFGTTAPGWALLLGAASLLTTLPVPVLGTLLTGASLLTIACLMLAEGRRIGRAPEMVLAGTLMLSNAYLWMHNGFETYPVLAVLLAAAALTAWPAPGRQRAAEVGAGLLAGLAVWMRPEAGLAAGLLGILLLVRRLRQRRPLPWVYAGIVTAVVAAGAGLAIATFDTLLPVTFEAKQIQAEWQAKVWKSGAEFWPAAAEWLRLGYTGTAAATLVFVLGGLAGWMPMLRAAGACCKLLALYALALLAAYPLLEVPFYTWYSIPVIIALTYGLAFAAGSVVRRLAGRLRYAEPAPRSTPARLAAWTALGAVVLLTALPVHQATARVVGGFATFEGIPLYRAYREAGEWLDQHAPPDATIAYVEVGTVAYFSRRTVRDLLGLVSPELLPKIARRDLEGAFLEAPTDYVLDADRVHGLMAHVVSRPWFAETYAPVAEIPIPGADDTIVIYRRNAQSTVAPGAPRR